MAKSGKLPGDYAIDALSLEVERRKKSGDYRCSYGKLVADTTRLQREEIAEQYRKELLTGKVGGYNKTAFLETEEEAVAEVLRKTEDEMAGE